MPVSFPVATHPAKPYPFLNGRNGYTANAKDSIRRSMRGPAQNSGKRYGESRSNMLANIPDIVPNPNSFVGTLLDAYTQDRAVVIPPDDVWLAIQSQFNLFMASLIEKNVVDPTLRERATPNFTTTTSHDTAVSAVLPMATLKQSTVSRPPRNMAAFDDPTSAENVDFWQRIANYTPGGSGIGNYYTGWITAFTVFSKKGQWMGNALKSADAPDTTLAAEQFWAVYAAPSINKDLILDGTPYHRIGRGGIPPDDTVRPVAGWWLYVKDEKKAEMEREEVTKTPALGRGRGRW
ncbi:hypothetical protein B0H13DRAFT_2313427 [Mycena leptocephala]|nr:hypothetical protein B0H13DRAFT_2313427 [Mycena leptocephala]